MVNSTRFIVACFLAELVGTFLLVLIGDGSIAAYVVTKQKVDVFSTCICFGIGAMLATIASSRISGAHINPAASLAFALNGQLDWALLPVYLAAQYLGGFLAALALFTNYHEAIGSLDNGARSAFGNGTISTGSIFATYPGDWLTIWGAMHDQMLGTAALLFALSAIGDQKNLGLEPRHQPIYVALTIGATCIAFSPNCGAIFNPARDLAPRLLTAIVGYSEPSVWAPLGGLYWLVAGVVGPHVGAIVGVFAYRLLISAWLGSTSNYEVESLSRSAEHQHQHPHQQQHHHHHHQQQPQSQARLRSTDFTKSAPETVSYGSTIRG